MVEGFLVPEADSIPRVLERRLRAAGEDVEVWNLGVGGSGLVEYAALLRDAASVLSPDEVIVVLHANDLLASSQFTATMVPPPAGMRRVSAWTPRLFTSLDAAVRGDPVPRRWHQAPFRFFPQVPSPANPWTARGGEFDKVVAPDVAQAMREGRFNPFNVGEVQAYEHYLRQPVEMQPWLRFVQDALGSNVRLLAAYIPQPAQVSDAYIPYKQKYCPPGVPSLMGPAYQQGAETLARQAASLRIPFADLTPHIRQREAAGARLYWSYDEHMNRDGYALAAEALQALRKSNHPGARAQ
jgi:hypothetical protein